MIDHIRIILQQNCFLNPQKLLVIGVSGGPDSLSLLDILRRLGYRLITAHYNHGLRPEAGDDARKVAEIAAAWGVPFVLGQGNAAAYAQEQGLSIEEAARLLRYQFLFEQAASYSAEAVAVAHNADDQVETVLMHLLRGAGLAGLKGMNYRSLPNAWSQSVALVRPLLGVWREEILAYCASQGLTPIIDASNQDTTFFRNRLRHELLPYLESYNPNIRNSMRRMAKVLDGDHQLIQQLLEQSWQYCLLETGPNYVGLDRQGLLRELPGLQRRLVRRAIELLRPGLRDIDFEMIERALSIYSEVGDSGRRDVGANLFVMAEGPVAWIGVWGTELPGGEWPAMPAWSGECPQLALPIPGDISLENGWVLHAQVLKPEGAFSAAVVNRDPYLAWGDASLLTAPLLVRCRLAGDRFQPLGLSGHTVKLADFMTNVKVPARARDTWPLVCSGPDIVWVPGYRLAHPYRVTPDTHQIFQMRLEKIHQ